MSTAKQSAEGASLSLGVRLRRILPYCSGNGMYFWIMAIAVLTAALTEPLIPALMKPLLDRGFQAGKLALWMVPVALLGLFAVRGVAGFCAQYSLAAMSNRTMLALRKNLFEVLQTAHPSLFAGTTASALVNTVVYEVQIGATLLVNALLSLLKDSLTLTALMGYLLYLNWKLTIIVLAVFPAVALVMKLLSKRLHRITKASQAATDELAYVVEENVLAYRTVRLHHAQTMQAKRFDTLNQRLRSLAMKSTIANSAMTPLTQMLAAVALSGVICVALWQSSTSGTTVGGFVAFTTAMLMLIAPIKHLSEVAGPITRGLAAVERGLDLMEHTRTEQGGAFVPTAGSVRGDIAFDNVQVGIGQNHAGQSVGPFCRHHARHHQRRRHRYTPMEPGCTTPAARLCQPRRHHAERHGGRQRRAGAGARRTAHPRCFGSSQFV
jgi:ATP-binding cassette, subfamily B, bacterial MsbA